MWAESVLAASAEDVTDVEPLRVEASHRCFYRLQTSSRTVVLMDSPPHLERNEQFTALGTVFHDAGIPVAKILSAAQTEGLFLLQDLGDVHFEEVYGTHLQDPALTAAVELLPRLGAVTHPAIEPYTAERLHMELDIFSEWFMGKLLNLEVYTGTFQRISERLVNVVDAQPKCCVHRDYHCRNLLYNAGQLGVVDYQDALHGPVLYDIASLLRDCYYTFAEPEVERWLGLFVSRSPQLTGVSAPQIMQWFDYTAMQRQLKAIGIFARLHLRDGKATHLQYIMPVLERIQTCALQYPELNDLYEQLNGCKEAATPILAKA